MSLDTSHDHSHVVTPDHPVPDPGLHEEERFTDVDEQASQRAYRQVVGLLAAVPVLAIAFVVLYFTIPLTLQMFQTGEMSSTSLIFRIVGGEMSSSDGKCDTNATRVPLPNGTRTRDPTERFSSQR